MLGAMNILAKGVHLMLLFISSSNILISLRVAASEGTLPLFAFKAAFCFFFASLAALAAPLAATHLTGVRTLYSSGLPGRPTRTESRRHGVAN